MCPNKRRPLRSRFRESFEIRDLRRFREKNLVGGRRFKSSLPDEYFQSLKLHFWFSVYINGVEIVDGRVFLELLSGFH